MHKGDTFTRDGVRYAIKQIFPGGEGGGRVDASKFKGDKLQKGRPCKFTVDEVRQLLGESTDDSLDDDVDESDEDDTTEVSNDIVDPTWEDVRDNREVVEELINQFRDSGTEITTSDW